MLNLNKKSVLAAAIFATISMNASALETKTAGGFYHNLFVNEAGDLYASGNNRYNQLGAMPKTVTDPVYKIVRDAKYLTPVHTGLVNVKSVAAAGYRSVALKEDGTVYFWGIVSNLKQGATADSYTTTIPKKVNISGVLDIAVAGTKVLFLKEGLIQGLGTVYEWNFVETSLPTKVAGLPEDQVKSIAAAFRFGFKGETTIGGIQNLEHFRALTETGEVYVWGHNDKGQLGLSDFVDRTAPVKLNTLARNIGVGPSTGFVVLQNGDVYQSGWFTSDGNKPGKSVPYQVMNAFGVNEVFANSSGAYAIADNGSVYVWGFHNYIGGGSYLKNTPAATVPELGTSANYIGTGNETFTVLKTDNTFHTIGGNASGQVGDNTIKEKHYFPNQSLVGTGTIAAATYLAQFGTTNVTWTDPEVATILTCLSTTTAVATCEPGYVSTSTTKEFHANNGWGNGSQAAPGNSALTNNAANNTTGKTDPTKK